MSKTTAKAHELVRSVLSENYSGAVLAILRKYHLVEPDGSLRVCTIGANKERGIPGVEGPILNPEVIQRFLVLDTSNAKRMFDWMVFASGGGTPHIKESEEAVKLAKAWVIQNRMQGKDREEQPMTPMTREQAEADWQQNEWPRYEQQYFFADQDLASDPQYPVYGWFREWPGRNNVYQKIEDGIQKFLAITKDKKLVSSWNKQSPKDKIFTDWAVAFWRGDQPIFADADALANFCADIKSTLARRKAEQNVVTVGKNPEGGYTTGSDEVLYDDENLQVIIPLTAGASIKKGWNDWCIANRSRWEAYFQTRDKNKLLWGGDFYTGKGPFAFFKVKQPHGDRYLAQSPGPNDPASFTAHAILGRDNTATFEFWDRQNQHALDYDEIVRRLRGVPGSKQSLDRAIAEVKAWLKEFKTSQLERFPSLESQAQALVKSLLA